MRVRNHAMRRSKTIILAIAITVTLSGCAAKQPAQPISETRLLLDTVCTITMYEPYDHELLSEALDLCQEYEILFSRTVEGSDVWRINNAGGVPVTVHPDTVELIGLGLEYCALSGGFFDITIGRLSSLWDFGGNAEVVPPISEIEKAIETIDFRKITITENTVQLGDPEAMLDLGGVAKGYIAEKLAIFLKEKGVKGAIIDLGGNIVAVGAKPDGSAWNIGVEKPFGKSGETLGVISTGAASIVTSGIYERQFVKDGKLYHHILDPTTGMPAESDVISATVITESSAVGDAFSTIPVLLGKEKTMTLIDRVPGLKGIILILENGEIFQQGDIDFIPL